MILNFRLGTNSTAWPLPSPTTYSLNPKPPAN
jgi:hypothetical protein